MRNFETARLKVSDADGNPVEIAAVVVYRVVDSAKAIFAVDDYVQYVAVQAETAVRHLATSYPYEAHDSGRPSLRDSAVVSQELTTELRERVELAGVEVLESRVTHLAYASEIAQAMLARQQANAIVAARFKIVEGAVGMVSNALELLREQDVVELDEERKAQMVSNLLVVLCGDRATQPVVNTGIALRLTDRHDRAQEAAAAPGSGGLRRRRPVGRRRPAQRQRPDRVRPAARPARRGAPPASGRRTGRPPEGTVEGAGVQ